MKSLYTTQEQLKGCVFSCMDSLSFFMYIFKNVVSKYSMSLLQFTESKNKVLGKSFIKKSFINLQCLKTEFTRVVNKF